MRSILGRAALLAFVSMTAACSSFVSAPGGSGGPSGSKGGPQDPIHEQANAALERWAAAVDKSGGAAITFTGDLTSQIGDWSGPEADNNKRARLAGAVESMVDLPTDPPSRGEVKWLDGTTHGVDVLSAAAALSDLVSDGSHDCDDCTPLRVTDARLAKGLVETSLGPAEAPIWVYALAGSDVQLTRVAVDDAVTVDPPPWNAEDPPIGIRIDRAVGSADSRELEVFFVGAADEGGKPCGADYTAEAVESDLAIVVIVTEKRNPAPGACQAMGMLRSAGVRLDRSLGNRAVLEVTQGLPVPLASP